MFKFNNVSLKNLYWSTTIQNHKAINKANNSYKQTHTSLKASLRFLYFEHAFPALQQGFFVLTDASCFVVHCKFMLSSVFCG